VLDLTSGSSFKSVPQTASGKAPAVDTASTLSPLARLVHEKSSFRYPAPGTPNPRLSNGQSTATAASRSPLISKDKDVPRSPSSSKMANKQAHAQNMARVEISIPTKVRTEEPNPAIGIAPSATLLNPEAPRPQPKAPLSTPEQPRQKTPTGPAPLPVTPVRPSHQPSPVSGKATISIDIPRVPPSTFNSDEFQKLPNVLYTLENLSTRKQGTGDLADNHDLYGGLDQRQRVNAAFNELQHAFRDIFQAEEDPASQSYTVPLVTLTNDQEPTLTTSAHQKIHGLLQKAISLGCMAQVPLDDLLRLQRLCDGALRHAISLDFKFRDDDGEADVESRVLQLPEVDTGLKAARTSLRIMSAGREEMQLYSEDVIQGAVDLFRNVMDGIIIPVAELRSSGPTERRFKQLAAHRKTLTTTFTSCLRLFTLMTELMSKTELSETVLNTLQDAASRLHFVENAHAERDSVLGVQKFDGLRLAAMDMLSQVFVLKPQLRQSIFDDILTSLEKLPVGKQKARQFKLADGRSIQPVSALIMRLVQASAGKVDDSRLKPRASFRPLEDDAEEQPAASGANGADGTDGANGANGANGDDPAVGPLATITTEERGAAQHSTAIQELSNVTLALVETARRNASYVVNYIVTRALTSTKSGETPYRNLLDLFVEDFTTCVDSPDWPGAELLLRILMLKMLGMVEGGEKQSAATAKNMALEVLGTLATAISKLRSQVQKSSNSVDSDELTAYLAELAVAALDMKSRPEQMTDWAGPYRTVLEHLEAKRSDDPHLASAISFVIADWSARVCAAYDANQDVDVSRDRELGRLAYRLRMMAEDKQWLSTEYSFKAVSAAQAKLSHCVIVVRSQLCECYGVILNKLFASVTSDQTTVRSKALRSINQLLETDAAILDGESPVMRMILDCSHDTSPQVRDSALSLVSTCIGLRPNLEETVIPAIVARFTDANVPVRKRAMKLARDVYLHNAARKVRAEIANGLLGRVQDPDEGVRELARQTVEEVWITPFQRGEGTAAYKTSLAEHVGLMVQTIIGGSVAPVLDKVLQTILSPTAKMAEANFEVCQRLVASMFELVDNADSDDPSVPSGRDALQALVFFAKADARLFNFEQIRLLKPHISTIGTSDDATLSRAVVVIYRRVLPQLSSVHSPFLAEVRGALLPAVAKLGRALLDDVMACLSIVSSLLGSTEHLARLVGSSLKAVYQMRVQSQGRPLDETSARKFGVYSLIIGMAGKHCDLDNQLATLRGGIPKWQGTSASALMVDQLVPFAKAPQSLEVKRMALDAVGLVCQSSPRNYVAPNVYTTFQEVFDLQNPALEKMVMRSLKEFLTTEEKRSEVASEAAKAEKTAGADGDKKRELTVMGGTNHDDVASATTQRFIDEFTSIALATLDDHAYLAVEILATIGRQGLVHPKKIGVTMIVLEASPVTQISELAHREHRALHGKHETVLERDYAAAVRSAFEYQRDIVRDARGARANPFTAKLHLLMEVLKDSKSKNRQRLLEKLCSQVDFDPAKLDASEEMPDHVAFARFVVENLAYFEYVTSGELQSTVRLLEKIVHTTGATVAHAIESDIFRVRMEIEPTFQPMAVDGDGVPVPQAPPVQPGLDPQRLRQLTAGSMVLSCAWEARTHLRRLYGLRKEKGKVAKKDLTKPPIKVPGATGDKFWEDSANIMEALASQARMLEQCRVFVDLLNVDKEFKVVDEDADGDGEDPTTPSGDDEDAPAERGRKRKATSTPGGRKKRPRSSSQQRKRGRPKKNQLPDEDAEADFDDDWV